MTRERTATITAGVIGGFAAYGIARADHRVWAYLFVTALLVTSAVIVDRRVRFTAPVLGFLAAALVLHLCGGLLPGPSEPILYDQWLVPSVVKFDQLVHFVNCAALTLACAQIVGRWVQPDLPPAGPAFAAAMMACGFGALNEAFEFISSLLVHDLDVGGYDNTGWDLVFNLAGAMTVATWLWLSGGAEVHDVADGEGSSLAVERLDDEVAALVDVDCRADDVVGSEVDPHPPAERR